MAILKKTFNNIMQNNVSCIIQEYTVFATGGITILDHKKIGESGVEVTLELADCEAGVFTLSVDCKEPIGDGLYKDPCGNIYQGCCGPCVSCQDNPPYDCGFQDIEWVWAPPCSYCDGECPSCFSVDECGNCVHNCLPGQLPNPNEPGCPCRDICDCNTQTCLPETLCKEQINEYIFGINGTECDTCYRGFDISGGQTMTFQINGITYEFNAAFSCIDFEAYVQSIDPQVKVINCDEIRGLAFDLCMPSNYDFKNQTIFSGVTTTWPNSPIVENTPTSIDIIEDCCEFTPTCLCTPCDGVIIEGECYEECDCENPQCEDNFGDSCQYHNVANACACVPCETDFNFNIQECCPPETPIYNEATGECVECETNGDCPACFVCVNGECVPLECPEGMICDPSTGNCTTVCDCDNPDCEPGQKCDPMPGVPNTCGCYDIECPENCDSNCPETEDCGCVDDDCVPCNTVPCITNQDCPFGCICEDGTCANNPCPTIPCNEAGDCEGATYLGGCGCEEEQCVPCSSVTCETSIDCPLGCYCSNGTCIENPCDQFDCETPECEQAPGCICQEDECAPCDTVECITITKLTDQGGSLNASEITFEGGCEDSLTFKVNDPTNTGTWYINVSAASGGWVEMTNNGVYTVNGTEVTIDATQLDVTGFLIRYDAGVCFKRYARFTYDPNSCSDGVLGDWEIAGAPGQQSCILRYKADCNLATSFDWNIIGEVGSTPTSVFHTEGSRNEIAWICFQDYCSIDNPSTGEPYCNTNLNLDAEIEVTATLNNDPDCQVVETEEIPNCCGCLPPCEDVEESFVCEIRDTYVSGNVYRLDIIFNDQILERLLGCMPPFYSFGTPAEEPYESYWNDGFPIPPPVPPDGVNGGTWPQNPWTCEGCGWSYSDVNLISYNGANIHVEVTGENPQVCFNAWVEGGSEDACDFCCCIDLENNCPPVDLDFQINGCLQDPIFTWNDIGGDVTIYSEQGHIQTPIDLTVCDLSSTVQEPDCDEELPNLITASGLEIVNGEFTIEIVLENGCVYTDTFYANLPDCPCPELNPELVYDCDTGNKILSWNSEITDITINCDTDVPIIENICAAPDCICQTLGPVFLQEGIGGKVSNAIANNQTSIIIKYYVDDVERTVQNASFNVNDYKANIDPFYEAFRVPTNPLDYKLSNASPGVMNFAKYKQNIDQTLAIYKSYFLSVFNLDIDFQDISTTDWNLAKTQADLFFIDDIYDKACCPPTGNNSGGIIGTALTTDVGSVGNTYKSFIHITSATPMFDENEYACVDNTPTNHFSLLATLVHEFAHILGIGHENYDCFGSEAIMDTAVNTSERFLCDVGNDLLSSDNYIAECLCGIYTEQLVAGQVAYGEAIPTNPYEILPGNPLYDCTDIVISWSYEHCTEQTVIPNVDRDCPCTLSGNIQVTCNESNGTFNYQFNPSGGNPPYQYFIGSLGPLSSPVGFLSDSYANTNQLFRIEDSFGCFWEQGFTLPSCPPESNDCPLTITIGYSCITYFTVTLIGDLNTPYSIEVVSGPISEVPEDGQELEAGIYTFSITICNETTEFTIIVPPCDDIDPKLCSNTPFEITIL